MLEVWLRGLDNELASDVKQNYKESTVMRKRLKQLLIEKIEETRNASTTREKYDSPNWPLLQADAMGYERGLRLMLSFLD